MVIRNYLPISGVAKSLLGITGDAVNSMVLITEEKLVKFCRSAEQADHTDFVIKRATVRGYKQDQQERTLEQSKELHTKFINSLMMLTFMMKIFFLMSFQLQQEKKLKIIPKRKKIKRKKKKQKILINLQLLLKKWILRKCLIHTLDFSLVLI